MDRIVAAMRRSQEDNTSLVAAGTQSPKPPIEGIVSPLGKTKQLATHLAAHQIISLDQADGTIDAYRMLRTQVLNRMRPNQHTTLAVASPTTGEGASHTAANLAMSMVMDPQNSVLLVDCDFKRPRVHELFDVRNNPGLSDYFVQGAPLADLVAHPAIERLAVLPAGAFLVNGPELLGSMHMVQLIKIIKAQDPRRLIIFDLPAILHSTNAASLAPLVDAVLMVVAERKAQVDQVIHAGEMLAGANLIGAVLNRASRTNLLPASF